MTDTQLIKEATEMMKKSVYPAFREYCKYKNGNWCRLFPVPCALKTCHPFNPQDDNAENIIHSDA